MKDETDYSIENLEFIFMRHAEEAEQRNKEIIDNFKKDYPNEDIPDHMKSSFNLAKALSVMANEINKFRKNERKDR